MTDQDQPDFNMGIEAQLFVHEGEDFSSSGDEAIINIKETEASINKDMNIENQNRFQCTTVEERDLLLSEAEAVNTKKATKLFVFQIKKYKILGLFDIDTYHNDSH